MEYKFIKDSSIINYSNQYLKLSYSTEKEIHEFFTELLNIKNITFASFIKNSDFNFYSNKKQNTLFFLKALREYRYPIMSKITKKIKNLSNSIKTKNISVVCPTNLEGDTLTLVLKLKEYDDIEKTVLHLKQSEDKIKKLLKTIKLAK